MAIFRTTFEYQIDVNFIDKEKAESFFLESDWKDCFYEFNDLDEAAEHVAMNFHNDSGQYEGGDLIKYIEGFGSFLFHREENEWRLTKGALKDSDELPCGDIIIKYEMNPECTEIREMEE